MRSKYEEYSGDSSRMAQFFRSSGAGRGGVDEGQLAINSLKGT